MSRKFLDLLENLAVQELAGVGVRGLPVVARQFRIAGGNIKNIAVLAAFLAAGEGSELAMRHLIHAARREYQKLGRLVTESDFAHWYEEARR